MTPTTEPPPEEAADHGPDEDPVGPAGTGSPPGDPDAEAGWTGSLARAAAYYELTKPGIAGFVAITTGVSYWVAAEGRVDWLPMLHTILGALAATAGALALNQYLERDRDALMHRTRARPLPSGRLEPARALGFGLILSVGGVLYLLALVGWVPAAITAISAVAYNLIYTPLKSRSYVATVVGAVPGALPALIGWTAVRPLEDWGALVLFGIAYLWQIPHVFALAWILRDDYERAGFLFMVPPTDPQGRMVGLQMVTYSTLLIPVSLMPSILRLTGPVYFTGALILGVLLWGSTVVASLKMTKGAARRVFLGSLLYHPALMLLMLGDTIAS